MLDYNQVIGHKSIKDHLKMAIENGRVSQAYIFSGEDGSGKKLLADIFAKTLLCEEGKSTPCNKCKSCLQMEGGNQPDLKYVTHEKAAIGVDDIRIQLNNDILIKPFASKYKIYIIDEAEKMTEAAQNALLKTIEEPPQYAVILLLTTNTTKLLPTILSRCVTVPFKAVANGEIKKYLMERYTIPDYLAEISAGFCQGNVGRAIKYATSESFIESKDAILHMLKKIDDMELYEIMESIKQFSANKLEVEDYIDLMILWYRDVLLFKVTKDPNLLLYKNEYRAISRQAARHNYEGIENIIQAMDKAKIRLRANVNFDIAIELMLLSLKEN